MEKKEHGTTSFSIKEKVKANSLPLPYEKSTAKIIAEQSNVSHQTVKNAEKFADAVDKVAENTGINPQKINFLNLTVWKSKWKPLNYIISNFFLPATL